MATNLRQDLLEDRSLKIDFIAGPDSYKRLPQLIHEASDEGQKSYDVTLSEFETYSDIQPQPQPRASMPGSRSCAGVIIFAPFVWCLIRAAANAAVRPENVVDEARRLAGRRL